MEDNEDQPEDVRKATPVEEEIARGEIDETSGGKAAPVEPARRQHRCDKDNAKRPKKPPKNEGDCCRERLAKAARLPETATFLVYEKECTLPRTKPIPRHCLTKEEWIDVLATPSRRCPPPCLQREVTRKIRPVSTRLAELARPPKNRLLNTLQDRAGTLPTELVDHLIQTLEGEACLTPEQAERMFRDKENRTRRKRRKRIRNNSSCKDEELKNQEKRRGVSSTAAEFDREAVNCQYLMAESFVRSILDWKCPIPREEFKDIAEVILQRLADVLEYKPVNGEDRKSQQMQFLADVVASWIAGVLFDAAEARRAELEEECERRRRAKEEESDEDTDDESDEEVGRGDDDDDDDGDGDDEKKDQRKKKKERPPKKRKDDRGKKSRKDRKDDDDEDDDDKLGKSRKKDEGEDRDGEGDGKPGSEDAEEKLKDDGDTEPTGGDAEEKDSGEEFHDARGEPGSSPEETEVTVEAEEIGEGEKSGERDQESPEAEKIVEETAAEAESAAGVAKGDGQIEQAEDDAASKIPKKGKPEEAEETEEAEAAVVKVAEATPMTIDEPIAIEPIEKIESTPTPIDEPVPIEPIDEIKVDQQTIEAVETGKMAAGDVKDAEELLPIESTDPAKVQEIPEGKEIPEDQAVDQGPGGAGDQEKEIQEPEKLSASEVTEIEKDVKVIEEPAKIVKIQSEVMDKREKPRRQASKIPSVVTLVGRKKLRTDAPFVTFDRIFHTIYSAIETSRENPGVDAITNRLHRAVYEKCSRVVQDDRPEPLPDLTKDVLDVMSGKIALWLRDVLTESELTFMTKFPATVESSSVREWSRWMGDVSDTANTWSTWIQRTIRQAEAMRSGGITRGDWSDWTKSVDEDAHLWRRFYVQSLHQAHQNLTMIRDRRVVKTGERKLDFDGYEREMKITDLETER